MNFKKKLLSTLIMIALLSGCFTATAFAAETVTGGEQITAENAQNTITGTIPETVSNTEANNNLIVSTGYAADTSIEGETLPVADPAAVSEQDNPELVLGKDYYIDEQGQVYYEEPDAGDEELVIEEDVEEEEEVIEEEKEPVVKKPTYSEKDLRLLSGLIYAEAGNQSYNGMLAVANVVLNRVKSNVYWHVNSIEEVIYDRKWSVQFSVTIKNRKTKMSMLDKALKSYDTGKFTGANPEASKKAMNKAIKAAKAALEGTNNIGSYLCFHSKSYASSVKRKYSDYMIIGGHIFFRTK